MSGGGRCLFMISLFSSRINSTWISQTGRRICTARYSSAAAAMGDNSLTNRVMLVKPSCFNFNPETAVTNKFQSLLGSLDNAQLQHRALTEFHALAQRLEGSKVQVNIFEDLEKLSSDAVFPNNWISFHTPEEPHGSPKIVIYPMLSKQRRREKNKKIISHWTDKLKAEVIDYSYFEAEGKFLEGTGSMVLDRVHRVAYSCISPRTNMDVLKKFCVELGYRPISFRAVVPLKDGSVQDVYHTNVMMSVGDSFAIICLESICDIAEREQVVQSLKETKKEIIPITTEQLNEFAGNVLQLASLEGQKHLLMSTRSYAALASEQLSLIKKHNDSVVSIPLDVIESVGGGGTRCMIAEVFPPLS